MLYHKYFYRKRKQGKKMKHTTKIELANRKDQFLAEAGVIKPEDIRQVTVEDAIVDTGVTGLSLPKPAYRATRLDSR